MPYNDGFSDLPPAGSNFKLACVGVLALVMVGVLALGLAFINTNNSLVGLEEGVVASFNDGENIHSNTLKKIKQAGFVTESYSKQVQEAISNAIRGRYGAEGIKANMTWIQEQNPTINPDLFQRVLVIIEAGNNEFAAKQTDRLDRVRVYKTQLRSFPGSLFASTLGFPKIDMAKYERVIAVAESQQAVETGLDIVVDPFSTKR